MYASAAFGDLPGAVARAVPGPTRKASHRRRGHSPRYGRRTPAQTHDGRSAGPHDRCRTPAQAHVGRGVEPVRVSGKGLAPRQGGGGANGRRGKNGNVVVVAWRGIGSGASGSHRGDLPVGRPVARPRALRDSLCEFRADGRPGGRPYEDTGLQEDAGVRQAARAPSRPRHPVRASSCAQKVATLLRNLAVRGGRLRLLAGCPG